MRRRQRKLIGTVAMLVFVVFYAMIVTAIAPRILLEGSKFWQMTFYVVAGLAWGIPLFPLIKWMEQRGEGELD